MKGGDMANRQVLILGGGYAGVYAALGAPAGVTPARACHP
jgi:hypothetical protein